MITAVATSGLTTWGLDYWLNSKVRKQNKQLQRKYEACDNFCSYIEKCQATGCSFWSIAAKSLSPDIASNVRFMQSRAEGAYYQIAEIGFKEKSAVMDIFDLLTGGDYDDLNRPARPETADKIALQSAELCTAIDKFKNTL